MWNAPPKIRFTWGAAFLALATTTARAQPVAFEVASVKQHKNYTNADFRSPTFLPGGRFTSTAPLDRVIAAAWHLPYNPGARLSGGPDWIRSSDGVYDIDARAERGAISGAEQMRPMLQKLLADRFQLVIRSETREMPVYVLLVAKGGPKLRQADIEEKDCKASVNPIEECHKFLGGRGRGLHARAVTMSDLVHAVEAWTDRPMIDRTGIAGLYAIDTKGWLPLEPGPPPSPGAKSEDGTDLADLPTIFQIFEGLGLRMEAQKGKAEVYVIDRIERPAEN